MFNRKERLKLIATYGKEDAYAIYRSQKNMVSEEALNNYDVQLLTSGDNVELQQAIRFIDYCYTNRTTNYDDIVDWLHTLRAIQRQIEG